MGQSPFSDIVSKNTILTLIRAMGLSYSISATLVGQNDEAP